MRKLPFVKRIIASVLCAALLFTGSLSTMATETAEIEAVTEEATTTEIADAVNDEDAEAEEITAEETDEEVVTEEISLMSLSAENARAASEVTKDQSKVCKFTWTYRFGWGQYFYANVYAVDSLGNPIDVSELTQNISVNQMSNTQNLTYGVDYEGADNYDYFEILANQLGLEGYEYQATHADDYAGVIVKNISYNRQTQNSWHYVSESGKWTGWKGNESTVDVYMVFSTITITEEPSISIIDSVETDGTLSVESNFEDDVTYVWYKSVNGDEYTKVERQKYTNGDYSISEDGKTLNIVLSGGALNDTQTSVKFKVCAFDSDGNELGTDEYNVAYYNKVQNGSFELPVNNDCKSSDAYTTMHQFLYATHPEVVWKATAQGVRDEKYGNVEIEIISALDEKDRENVRNWYNWYCGEKDYENGYQAVKAADGNQFAEINCEAEAALYQDVLTVKGQELNYWLSHRARGTQCNSTKEYDTMYVVIMPTDIAKTKGTNGGEVDTQAELTSILESCKSDANIAEGIYLSGEYEGTYIRKIKSDDQAWHYYEGTYVPTSYMSRFFFVAGDKSEIASNNSTVGNFVDNIGFSQELPPAADGTFTLEIQKTIEGVFGEDLEKAKEGLTFTIHATKEDGAEADEAPLNGSKIAGTDANWEWTENADGSVIGTYRLKNVEINIGKTFVYTVEETASLEGYNFSSEVDVISSSKIDNSSATIKEKSSAIFTFTNTYEKTLEQKTVSSTREFNKSAHVYNWDERTYDITLSATVYDTVTTEQTKAINVALVLDTSGSMLFPSDLEEVKNVNSLEQLDKDTDYFYVEDSAQATVYRIYYQKDAWRYKDASYDKTDSAAEFKLTAGQTIYYSTTGKTRLEYLQTETYDLINALPEGSIVSLITFNSDASVYNFNESASESYDESSANNYTICITDENRSKLIEAVKSITTAGGTRQDKALECAQKVIDKAFPKSKNSYVIFLTDGCPNDKNATADNVKEAAVNAAETIKKNATIYSIGIDLDLNDQMEFAKGLVLATATGTDTYKNVKSSELGDTFKALTKEMTSSEDVTVSYSVKDYIDDRFIIADENRITELGGTVKEDANGVYVLWENIEQTEQWEKTFTVVANENFAGGNAVTTNKGGSGIFVVNEDSRYFENPVVNVKPTLEVENAETTIFLGEKVSLTDGTWYSDEDCTIEIDVESLYPTDTVTYYQKVFEQFDKPTDESNKNTDGYTAGKAKNSEEIYEIAKVGTYTINVVSAQLDVTKKSQSTKNALAGATYELKMTTQSGGISYADTERESSLDDGKMTFDNLPIGEYALVETIAPTGYSVSKNIYKVVVSNSGIEVTLNEDEVVYDKLESDESLRNVNVSFDVFDVMLYTLPETGGAGIFAYMFGGMFLMMAGALYIFVCRRKTYRV